MHPELIVTRRLPSAAVFLFDNSETVVYTSGMNLQEKLSQRDYDMACLNLWCIVNNAGIDPENVKTFTFREEFLTKQQASDLRRASYAAKRDVSKYWHNCVRLKDDTLVGIPLTKSPKRKVCDFSAFSDTLKQKDTKESTPPLEHGWPSA